MTTSDDDEGPKLALGDISTSWRRVQDPLRFVMTYGPAVRVYLLAILRDEHEAEDALQDLLVQVTERGFPGADPARGRFRDYLRAVARNAARTRLKRRPAPPGEERDIDQVPTAEDDAGRAWKDEWRQCVLGQALRALDRHQLQAGKGNLAYTAVRLTLDHPDEDSQQLAARASALVGQPLTAEAFRKQLSRARRTFAELIAAEVRQTLDGPTAEQVREELADLDLLVHLRDYLPPAG